MGENRQPDNGGRHSTYARADARRNYLRILKAAGDVFTEQGASASTEMVATRAGVAVGTVFRHFPTKSDLLGAVVMGAWDTVIADTNTALDDPKDAAALGTLCMSVLQFSASKSAVFARLNELGTSIRVADALRQIRDRFATLLARAQGADLVRPDLRTDELIAILAALSEEAIAGSWTHEMCQRALVVLFEGVLTVSVPRPAAIWLSSINEEQRLSDTSSCQTPERPER